MNLKLLLEVLATYEVDFIVVGGVAAVAHGSSLMTRDLDILYRLEKDNVERLVAVFDELEAVAYGDPRRLRFGFQHLNNTGHHLAETRAGRLDAHGSIGKDGQIPFETVLDDTVAMNAFGVTFRWLSLDRLIEVKRELGRPRDLLAVQELEALKKLKEASR